MKDSILLYPGPNLVYPGGIDSEFWKYFSYHSSGDGITIDPNIPVDDTSSEKTIGLKIVTNIGHYTTERFPIHLGNLDREREDRIYYNPVKEWVEHKQITGVSALLFYAPFWIEQIANEVKEVAGTPRHGIGRALLVYRLTEICLRVIDQWERDRTPFNNTQTLLIRQRYRYLLGIGWLRKDKKEDFDYIANFDSIIRRARSDYANLLLEKPERIEMALNETVPSWKKNLPLEAVTTDPKTSWDLDGEVELLLYQFNLMIFPVKSTGRLLPFAWEYLSDQILTDQLLRQWMLARDDLKGATRVIASVLYQPTQKDGKELKIGWYKQLISYLYNKIHWIFIGFAILCLAGLAFEQWLVVLISWILVIIFPALILFLTHKLGKFPWEVQVFYPLALRIPAMGMVGILAVAGLADNYITFGFSAFSYENWLAAVLLVIGCLVPSWWYIRFEVNSRRINPKYARSRSWLLFLYCYAASIWLGTFAGLLADPIGLIQGCLMAPYVTFPFGYRISFSFVIIISALSLLVGVFTQIFWEDKSIAEPL